MMRANISMSWRAVSVDWQGRRVRLSGGYSSSMQLGEDAVFIVLFSAGRSPFIVICHGHSRQSHDA